MWQNKKIAVVMGGPSTEREVSRNTGRAVLEALLSKGYNAVPLELVPATFVDDLRREKAEIVFNALHGKFGEDGVIQGVLDLLGIPYTGSGVMACAVSMDKTISKKLFLASGIPTPRAEFYHHDMPQPDIIAHIRRQFNGPVVVKNSTQGSSIGVTIVKNDDQLPAAVAEGFKYGDTIVVEEFIAGPELTVAVMDDSRPTALPVIKIVPNSGQYDYHSKYTKGATQYIVPAPLPDNVTEKVQKVAVAAFQCLGCQGVARVDLMLDEDSNPYVLEINTVPGLTATSLVPKAAAVAGWTFADLCEKMLDLAMAGR